MARQKKYRAVKITASTIVTLEIPSLIWRRAEILTLLRTWLRARVARQADVRARLRLQTALLQRLRTPLWFWWSLNGHYS